MRLGCGSLIMFKFYLWFFPGMTEMVRKVTLSRAVRTMQDLFPVEYNFYPRSWILPEEFPLFVTEVSCSDSEQCNLLCVVAVQFFSFSYWPNYLKSLSRCKGWHLFLIALRLDLVRMTAFNFLCSRTDLKTMMLLCSSGNVVWKLNVLPLYFTECKRTEEVPAQQCVQCGISSGPLSLKSFLSVLPVWFKFFNTEICSMCC